MKKIEIVLNGEQEEQIAQDIMMSIYGAFQKHGYCDTQVHADTIPEPKQELQIPGFMRADAKERGFMRKRG